jgi:zinc transport system substrate-binding protein
MRFIVPIVLLIAGFSTMAHGETALNVYAVNYPLAYFAERIGTPHVAVTFPAPPDTDPAFWSPDQDTIRQYQQADLILLNGAGYAKWTQKVSLPMLRTVDTSRRFRDTLINIEGSVTHSHGPEGDHSHGDIAFTTWLDFSQAAQQAEEILVAFIKKRPQHKEVFTQNYEALAQDLMDLDEQMLEVGKRLDGIALFASHPIYHYLARRYLLNLEMVTWEPDVSPSDAQWHHLTELHRDHPAKWMIWEGEPLASSARRLEEMNITGLVFSPCFSTPTSGDFITVMKENIAHLEGIL